MRLVMLLLIPFVPMLTAGGCDREENETSTPESTVFRLHEAARKGDIEMMRSLVAGGCNVDARDARGCTPLYTATEHGRIQVAEFLISKGADVNVEDQTGCTVLEAALSRGPLLDIAELLVAAGADTDRMLHAAAPCEQEDVEGHLLFNVAQNRPDRAAGNEMLLLFAVRHGMRDLVEQLLRSGADPNAVDHGRTGLSALTAAVSHGHKEVAMLLLAHGADANQEDDFQQRPLCYATSMSRDVAELLLAHGADVNAPLVLQTAVARGDRAMVELFLTHGADVNMRDAQGETPLDEAVARGHRDIVELLQKHGATTGQN